MDLLPDDYYALAERHSPVAERGVEREPISAGRAVAEQITPTGHGAGIGVALADASPRAPCVGEVDEAWLYALKRWTVAIRRATDDRIVALLEIASPGNKDRPQSVQRFVDKAVASIQSGYHLVVVDLFPPSPSDPAGLGSAVWEAFAGKRVAWPPGQPLTSTALRVADRVRCYGGSCAVGDALPEIPLFYDPDWYINLPLEATYMAAYGSVPRRWKRVIEGIG